MSGDRSTRVATLASLEACDVRVVDPEKVKLAEQNRAARLAAQEKHGGRRIAAPPSE